MVRHSLVQLPAWRLLQQSSGEAPHTFCCSTSCYCSCILRRHCSWCRAAPLLSSHRRCSCASVIVSSPRIFARPADNIHATVAIAAALPTSNTACMAATAPSAGWPFLFAVTAAAPGVCGATAAVQPPTIPPAFLRTRVAVAAARCTAAGPAASAAVSTNAAAGSATAASIGFAASACAAARGVHQQQLLQQRHSPTRHAAACAASLSTSSRRFLSTCARRGAVESAAARGPVPFRCTYTAGSRLASSSSFSQPRHLHRYRIADGGGLRLSSALASQPLCGCRTSFLRRLLPQSFAAVAGAPAAASLAAVVRSPPVAVVHLSATASPPPFLAAAGPPSQDASAKTLSAAAATAAGHLPLLLTRSLATTSPWQTRDACSTDGTAAAASPVAAAAAAPVSRSTVPAFFSTAARLTSASVAVCICSLSATAACGAPFGRPTAAVVAPYCGPGVAAAFATAAASSPTTACRDLHATAAAGALPEPELYSAAFAAVKDELSKDGSSSDRPLLVYAQRFSHLLFDFLMGLTLTIPLSSSKPLPSFLPPIVAETQQLLLLRAGGASVSGDSSSSRDSAAADEAEAATADAQFHRQQLQRLRSLEAPAAAALLLFVAVVRCRSSVPAAAAAGATSAATREKGISPAAAAEEHVVEYKLPRLLLLEILVELGVALSLREAQLTPQHLLLLRVALELLQGEDRSSSRRMWSSSSSASDTETNEIPLLQQLRGRGGALGAIAADFYELLPLHPAIFAEQLPKDDDTAAARGDGEEEEEGEEDETEKEEEETAAGELRGAYGEADDFAVTQDVYAEADAAADVADFEGKSSLQASDKSRETASEDSSGSSSSSGSAGRGEAEVLKEISQALVRLEKSHDALPTYIGPFIFTLRNSATKELYVYLKQRDFFLNDPERLLPKEEWRYRIAQQRGWKVIRVASEQAWSQLPSAAAKLQYVEKALLQRKPVL